MADAFETMEGRPPNGRLRATDPLMASKVIPVVRMTDFGRRG